jgi:AraC family transcriptional regulator
MAGNQTMNTASRHEGSADAPAKPGEQRGAARLYARALAPSGGREVESLARDGVAVVLYESPAYDVQVPAMVSARLSINLTAARVEGALDGQRRQSHAAKVHSLFLTPAGVSAAWRKSEPSRHINIYFDPLSCGGTAQRPLLNGSLHGGRALIDALADELAGGDDFADEAADSLARMILVRLTRQRAKAQLHANPLTPMRLRRLADYVQAHLEQRILVADLAAVAELPVNRFAAAFVAATGQSPHQYVLMQRLARAEAMLRFGTEPLAEVAAASGFSSQQHMTQVMRIRTGRTPARLRSLSADPHSGHEPDGVRRP